MKSLQNYPLISGDSPFIIGIAPETNPPEYSNDDLINIYPSLLSVFEKCHVYSIDLDKIYKPTKVTYNPPRTIYL